MKYAIIENDALSLERITAASEKLRPEWKLAFTARSIDETVACLDLYPDIELLICDIELEDGSIFNLFHVRTIECPIIFLTAYDEYALEAFRLFSIDYLLKPLNPSKLDAAFVKLEGIERRARLITLQTLENLGKALASKRYIQRLLITIGDRFESIDIRDVVLFYNEGKYIYVINNEGKAILTSFHSLNDIEELLDPAVFFHATRDTILTIEVIESIVRSFNGKLKVVTHCHDFKREIYVSAARRNDFLSWLGYIDQ